MEVKRLAGNSLSRKQERSVQGASRREVGRWLGHQWADKSVSSEFWNVPWALGLCSQVLKFGAFQDWPPCLCA